MRSKKSEVIPTLSVIMPVHNAQDYLSEAIESILGQTLSDFELIIINDGSTDDSKNIIASYKDPRIRVYTNARNQGIVSGLNKGLEMARADYIARMDADDISVATRFSKQISYIKSHADVTLLGSWFCGISESGKELYTITTLTRDPDIQRRLFVGNGFGHGTVVFNKAAALQVGGYRQEYWPCEDYDLWRRLATVGKLANIPEVLYYHRINSEGISLQSAKLQSEKEKIISTEVAQNTLLVSYKLKQYIDSAVYYRGIGRQIYREFIRHNFELLMLIKYYDPQKFLPGLMSLLIVAPLYTLRRLSGRGYRWFVKRAKINT